MVKFQQFIKPFITLLQKVNVDTLQLAEYPAQYLHQLLNNKDYYLHIYANVLHKVVEEAGCGIEDMVLLDYGCGNGLLGIFARFCHCKTVYLVDHNAQFIDASKKLANALGISISDYIAGDVETVTKYFYQTKTPDVVIATDVIEHIYDLDNFLNTLGGINKRLVTVFTTASVTENYFKAKQIMKLQYNDEHVGSNALHACANDLFAGLPFKKIREEIIKTNEPNLPQESLQNLVRITRGLHKAAILKTLEAFRNTGKLPTELVHATNTCDPITGSWTERLLSINEYKQLYTNAGFSLQVYNGFYNQWQGGVKAAILKICNVAIRLLKKRGKTIAPFIILVGSGNKKI